MLVDARAVKLQHPSFIIPNIDNSCAVYTWGISSRLPKLFTFQRARGRNHLKLSNDPCVEAARIPSCLKTGQGGISYPPQSRRQGVFEADSTFFTFSGKFVTAATATVIVDAPIDLSALAATSRERPVVSTSSTNTTGLPCKFAQG